ncbi:MAG: hypothetical protein U5K29_09885 [Acidimicrobiales bacterium]|nr:hypothetical protein [Acidimicrobiales bacterium]
MLGLDGQHHPPSEVTVRAGSLEFRARVRIDTPQEAEFYRHGGILEHVLRRMVSATRR